MNTALGLFAVVVLIALNGYFVAAEFAYVAVRRSALEQLADDGHARAGRAVTVLDRLSFMLSGAQLGITATSLVVGYIAQPTIGDALEPLIDRLGAGEAVAGAAALVVAFTLATVSQMVFGELAPKNLAIARATGVSLSLSTSLVLYTRLGAPLIRLFDSAANRLLRAVGIEPLETLQAGVTADELDFIVVESARGGELTGRQARLLSRAIEFGELDAGAAMRPRQDVITVGVDMTIGDVRATAASEHSRLPVVADDPDDVVGVLELKDLLSVRVVRRNATVVADIMREPLFVPEQMPLPTVLDRMREHITEVAVVVDEYGGFAGIITDEDLAEELVGPIADEHDAEPEPVIESLGERRWLVPGSSRLDEIERDAGVDLPDGEYDTVAGLVLDRLEHFPEIGEQVTVDRHIVTVTAMDGRRITSVELRAAAPRDDDGTAGTPGRDTPERDAHKHREGGQL